jgi:hypothetical protein
VKPLGYKAAHTSASNAEVKNEWVYKSTHPRALMKYTLTNLPVAFVVYIMFCKASIYFFAKQINIYYRQQSAVSIKPHARPGSCRGSVRIYERPAEKLEGIISSSFVSRFSRIALEEPKILPVSNAVPGGTKLQ